MIENELKYVLDPRLYGEVIIGKYPGLRAKSITALTQGYHKNGGRFRQERIGGAAYHSFNYKVDLPTMELEEFEQSINQSSYDTCIKLCKNVLRKLRISTLVDGNTWDLDFFVDASEAKNFVHYQPGNPVPIYFCMAECEMPSGMLIPMEIPDFITDHLLFTVPRERSSDYSSKKLSNRTYANDRMRDILEGKG